MSAPVCLLVNPAAGGGRAERAVEGVMRSLGEQGLQVRCERTLDLQHARELARRAARAHETIVCLSGDGMVGAVASVLRDFPQALLGILPGGRGNDLARVLGIPQDPVRACQIIAHGVPHLLDLGEADGRVFVGIASVGFDSEANRIANEAPARLGKLVYAYGALRALLAWKPVRFDIELDPPGKRYSFTGYTVGAANSKAYGGGMYAAPDALLDDGMLDVVVLEDIGKLAFVTRLLPRLFKGTHVREPSVTSFRAREVSIGCAERPMTIYADGDPIARLPARIRVLPGAVRVLVPAAGRDRGAFLGDGQ